MTLQTPECVPQALSALLRQYTSCPTNCCSDGSYCFLAYVMLVHMSSADAVACVVAFSTTDRDSFEVSSSCSLVAYTKYA